MTIGPGHDGEVGLSTHFTEGVLHVSGEIDSANCRFFASAVMEHDRPHITIDASQLRFCDSACLAVIIDLVRDGRQVTIIAPQPQVRRVLEVVGALRLDGLTVV